MRPDTAVQLSEAREVVRVPVDLGAGIEEETDDASGNTGPELWVKGVSVDVRADDIKLAEQLVAYLNAYAEAKLEALEEKGASVDKSESRRSVLTDALHAGIIRRVAVIEKLAGSELPPAKDVKAMKAYAKSNFAKSNKRG